MEIDVTGINPIKLVKTVYSLSVPRGLGFFHFRPGPLSDEEAKQCIAPDGSIHMDYVRGRGCKFNVWVRDGKRFMRSPWYDHTDEDLKKLMEICGVPVAVPQGNHGASCACPACEAGRAGVTN